MLHLRITDQILFSRMAGDDWWQQRALFRGASLAMLSDTVWPLNPYVAGEGGIRYVRSALGYLAVMEAHIKALSRLWRQVNNIRLFL